MLLRATDQCGRCSEFGIDLLVRPLDPNDARVGFCVWDCARERCRVIAVGKDRLK